MLIPFRSNYALVSMILLIKQLKTSLLHFESVILYAPLNKDKLRTTAGDRGGAGLLMEIDEN